ncbi:Acg family FMN-binding oxidoreductase [Streptomyces sp. NPDC004065]|uniref:Acg family FMN-binding oxidoreductase n=1 Tax=Streptomyces sp. NPDC004065 TaxID=3364689 RepID=UPI00385140E4
MQTPRAEQVREGAVARTPEVDAAALEKLLYAAVAAPSIHNTQPWRFGLDAETRSVHVRADRERRLRLTDPHARAQHLSVGAAVFNLRVAAAHLGWDPVVELLPERGDPELLATVRLCPRTPDAEPSYAEPSYACLYDAVGRRHTSRMPFTGRPVPDHVVAEMVAAARTEGAHLDMPDIAGTRRLLRLTALAEARNTAHPGRRAEARGWVTAPRTSARYGIPVTSLGPLDPDGRMPMRDFTGPLPGLRLPALRFERHAQVALLWTTQDRRADWLRAGQALERALLVATRHGVRTSMLHQAMEWPDLREAMTGQRRRCFPHLLIRFGYGPEGGRTPRATAFPTPPDAPRPAA